DIGEEPFDEEHPLEAVTIQDIDLVEDPEVPLRCPAVDVAVHVVSQPRFAPVLRPGPSLGVNGDEDVQWIHGLAFTSLRGEPSRFASLTSAMNVARSSARRSQVL